MNRNQLLQALKSTISRVTQATKDSFEALKNKVNQKSQAATTRQSQLAPEPPVSAMSRLKHFYQKSTERINQRIQASLQDCLTSIRSVAEQTDSLNKIGIVEQSAPAQVMESANTIENVALNDQPDQQSLHEVRPSSPKNDMNEPTIDHYNKIQIKDEIIDQPSALITVSSSQNNHKPTERLYNFFIRGLNKIIKNSSNRPFIFRNKMSVQVQESNSHQKPEDTQIIANDNFGVNNNIEHNQDKVVIQTDNPILKNEQLLVTTNFPDSAEEIAPPESQTEAVINEGLIDSHIDPYSVGESLTMPTQMPTGIREPIQQPIQAHRTRRVKRSSTQEPLNPLTQEPIQKFQGIEVQDDKLFVEYVEEQRISKLKYDVQQLKKEHIPTNYDASDEESNGHNNVPNYMNSLYKHKTEVSTNFISKIYEPRIQVNQASIKQAEQTMNLIEDYEQRWPITQPKKKLRTKGSVKDIDVNELIRSPINKIKKSKAIEASPEHDLAQCAEKILKLREARRKKMELESKLESINRKISEIRNPQKSMEMIKSPNTQKNSMKQMINISDDKDACNKALTFVRKLKIQREKREKAVSSIFSKVDKEMAESIVQLNELRSEQERKSKEKRRLQILERMKVQERRKLDEHRLQSDNLYFLQAVKSYQHKTRPTQSRKSMAWTQLNDTPKLAARKEVLERLRNLSYVEKRSLIEEYNRELMRK